MMTHADMTGGHQDRAESFDERVRRVFHQNGPVRGPQLQYADHVAGFLKDDTRLMLAEAPTGVGKTWGYLVPALLHWAETGARVIVSTHTLTLLHQIARSESTGKMLDWIEAETGRRPSVGVRLGMRNFLSYSRLGQAKAAHSSPGMMTDADKEALKSLEQWARDTEAPSGGQIQAWIDSNTPLPFGLTPGEICLLATCPASDRAAYEKHKEDANENADLLVQTHALTLIQALRGDFRRQEAPGILILDEADAIPAVAAGMAERRISLQMLTSAVESLGEAALDSADLDSAVAAFQAWSETIRPRPGRHEKPGHDRAVVLVPGTVRDQAVGHAQAIAEALRAAARGASEDHALKDSLVGMAEGLRRFAGHNGGNDPERDRYSGSAIVWRFGQEPSFVVSALRPGRLLSRLWKSTGEGEPAGPAKIILTSATLDPPSDPPPGSGGDRPVRFPAFEREVGIRREESVSRHSTRTSTGQFGKLSFVLADRKAPRPNQDEDPEDADGALTGSTSQFLDYAAGMVRAAMAEAQAAEKPGKVLVLTTSYTDAAELAARVPGLVAHARGTRLDGWLPAYRESNPAALVTPAGWAGLDLPGMVQHLVITRLPFAPPDPVEGELLRRVLTAAGYDAEHVADGILRTRTLDEARRRFRQGLGRALRRPDDEAKVWIADPRFPLPDAIVRDRRRGLSQGQAQPFVRFIATIPERFRKGPFSPWDRAEIHPHVPSPQAP